MKKKWLFITFVIVALLVIIVNERPSRYYQKPKPDIDLIDGLMSGSSMNRISNKLTQAGFSVNAYNKTYPSKHSIQPPPLRHQILMSIAPKVQMGQMIVTNYVFGEIQGALLMNYFNDHLWCAGFSCTNRQDLAHFLERCNTHPNEGEYLNLRNGAVVSWREKGNWAVVEFIDPRYRRQIDRWQKRFEFVMYTK